MRVRASERFVQQQQARAVDQRARQGDRCFCPPDSAAGQSRAIRQADRVQRLQRRIAPLAAQPQPHVVDHRFPRQQARILKHQPGILFNGGKRRVAAEHAAAGLFQAGQQAQQGALPQPLRPTTATNCPAEMCS